MHVVDLTIAIEGLEDTHWRRLAIPAGWSLRGTAALVLSAFNRAEGDVVWFEAGGVRGVAAPRPDGSRESRTSHLAGDDEPTFAQFLGDVEKATAASAPPLAMTLVDVWPPQGTSQTPRGDEPWFAVRSWRHRILVHERRIESGSDPVPRCVAAAGCGEDASGLCNAEFIERIARWRAGKRCRDSYERFFRDDERFPDQADMALIDWNLMGTAAPVWKRMLEELS